MLYNEDTRQGGLWPSHFILKLEDSMLGFPFALLFRLHYRLLEVG